MKKVALISPKGAIFGKNKRMKTFLSRSKYMESFKFLWTGPNLGLLTVAALMPGEWECEYLDENYLPVNFDRDYDLVCIGAVTQQAVRAYEIAAIFREKNIPVVMGGIHATLLPEEAANYVDTVIAGEVEVSWREFLHDLNAGKTKKIYTDQNPGYYKLNESPLPRYDLLREYNYPLVTLQTTRGCPHECSFCAASKVYGRSYRRKTNRQILEELSVLSTIYKGELILFADDNMFVKRKETKNLLRDMNDMGLRWIAQTDVSIANDSELLVMMTLAGCQWVVIGFESTSCDSLRDLDDANWKLQQFNDYSKAIEKIQSHGIGVYGTFMVGLDHDGPGILKATADFIKENNLYGANITLPTPLPGTRLRKNMEKEGRILDRDWSFYTFWDVNIKPLNFTVKELADGLLDVYNTISNEESVQKRLGRLHELAKKRKAIVINR